MKKEFFVFTLLFMVFRLFAHNDQSMARAVPEDQLTKVWSQYIAAEENSIQSQKLLREFLEQIENRKRISDSIVEFESQETSILNKLKTAIGLLIDSPEHDQSDQLRLQIEEQLIQLQTFEKAVSDYKLEKLFKLFAVTLFLLLAFVVTSIILVFTSNNARQREKRAKAFNNQIIHIQETERKRISNELHDTITQDIRTALIFVRKLQEKTSDSTEEVTGLLEKINSLETQNLKNIRNIIHNLTPPEIETANFRQHLAEYCANITEMTGIPCICYIEQSPLFEKLTSIQKLNLFRIIQESITNSIKHAQATEISLIARQDNNNSKKLVFFISDNGKGFEAEQNPKYVTKPQDIINQSTHLGLSGMKNRASLINAALKITSDEETGTEIKVELEVEEN